jgi:zinc transporter ZupT
MIDVIVSIISRLQYETYKVKKSSTSAHVAKPDFDVNMDLEADGPIGGTQDDKVIPHCVGCSKDPVAELNELKAMAEMKAREGLDRNSTTGSHCTTLDEERVPPVLRLPSQNYHSEDHHHHNEACHLDVHHHHEPHLQITAENPNNKDDSSKKVQVAFLRTDDHTKLIRMGLSIGIAITLHNVPEGFATFFSAIDDTRIGVLLAVAIALHNLPMGICICFPIYYATGQRWKGFLWGFAIGLTQPIAALFGWLMINDSISDDKYGIIFGIVGGLMLMIALKELLPTAHKYDPEDSVVTYSLLCGMGIMALSLVLFEVA